MPNMKCPRCETGLTRGTFASARIHRCDRCSGIALKQPNLIPVLENLSTEVYGDINVGVVPPGMQDNTRPLNCPECHSIMERHGYIGGNQLLMDSCNECTMLWLDTDELATILEMRRWLTSAVALSWIEIASD